MNQAEYYMNLPFDLAGSRSKNRFRLELLWGVSKMLELMESSDDFTMVFDYVCDIEIHLDSKFEFYQIKTHKEGQSKYTPKSLVKKKSSEEGSILGKLFVLNKSGDSSIKVVLVCNAPFTKLTNNPGETCLDKLDADSQTIIVDAIKGELGVAEVDLSNAYYLYTPMNLIQPEDEIKGKLVTTFENLKGSEPLNPNALYRLVFDTVSEKACYEFSAEDYEQLKSLKGISRSEFEKMLAIHSTSEKTGVNQTNEYINGIKNIHERKTYKSALTTLIPKMARSRELQNMEREMIKTLEEHPEIAEMDDIIELLADEYHHRFPLEYSNAEKTVYYMVIIHKFVEGGYDNET